MRLRLVWLVLAVVVGAACGDVPADLGAGVEPPVRSTPVPPGEEPTGLTSDPDPPFITDITTDEPDDRPHSTVMELPESFSPPGRYRTVTTVIQDGNGPVVACMGVVLTSYPPQCGGVAMDGFDWEMVAHEEAEGGEGRLIRFTSGGVLLEGHFEGSLFVVETFREATLEDRVASSSESPDYSSPCPPPADGWTVVDETKVGDRAVEAATLYARSQSDLAALWVTQPPREFVEPDEMIINVAFTGNRQSHEAALRELYGGPLCVVERPWTVAALQAVQEGILADRPPFPILWGSTDELAGKVGIGVLVADEETQLYFDVLYGRDVVVLEPVLHRIDA